MNVSYIAKGETLSCQKLITENLVVDGYLKVSGDLKAKTISGNGFIEAGRISAIDIHVSDIEAASVFCQRLIAERVETSELVASESAAVSLYIGADRVRTPRLLADFYDVDELEVSEIIHPKRKIRGMLRFVLVANLRAWWMKFITPKEVINADYEPEGYLTVMDLNQKEADRPAA